MKTQRVIWFAIAFSTVLYLVIAYMLHGNPEGMVSEKIENPMILVLYVAAAVMFLVASVVPQRLPPGQQKMIIGLAMFESCAIFGLLASFLGNDWRLYIAPWVLALIGFMRVFPSDETATDRG